ncbi:hypothetical protein OC861_006579 [Tilletia horrida]|nr:hypothetical protein OC861_006579 [Tilletia horrida]
MAVQTQHSPGSLPILGPDEAGPLEPPDSSAHSIDNNNNNNSNEHTPSINQQLANNPQVQAPPHLFAPSPAHLILTHNNGPHVSLMPTLSTPPASAAIVPNRFRKLSFSDNQPIVPSPLHTELAHATDDGITPSTTTRSPLDDPEPSSPIAKRLAALQLNTVKRALADEDDEDDDDDDEANTTPTSSIYTPSEAAESELSRTSYESSVLAPISEAPDSSFTSSASDPDPDTTPVVNTPKTAPLSFLGTPPRNHDEHKVDRADHPTLRITRAGSSDRASVLDEEDVATPTSSIIRSRSDSAMSSATSSKTGSHLASDERSSAGVICTDANTSDANPSATSSAAQAAAAAAAATSATTATPSTNLARSGSGRRLSCPTKASSPAASATKTKLRPCFRRRASAQSTSALSTTSSSDIDDGLHPQAHHRGRSVRFSPGPPQEVRTHSPVEYDRKSCTVNHRLTMEDVEEMRKMEMGLGLLEAKWAAAAACKAASAPSPASAAAAASKIHHPSPYSEDDDSSASSPKGCEAEIKFHSAAGVAGMRRSQRPSWEREQEWDGYDRDRGDRRWDRERTLDSRIRVDGSGPMLSPHASGAGGRLGLTRQYSAGGSNPNLAPPLGSSGLARRGTVTRTTSASVYNRADYSDSSESEYEMPYASSVRARVAGPAVGGSSSSSSSSSTREPMLGGGRAASSKSLSTWSAPTTSAPPMSSSLTSPGPATEGGAGCGAVWQPPDRCRNGYTGGWPGQHAASRRGGSSSGSSSSGPGSSVGMSASCSLPSAFGAASTSAGSGASGSAGAGATKSIIARFGLNSPPPPLPGGVAAANAAAAPPLTDHYHSGWGSGSLSNHSSPGTGGGGAMSGYAPGGYVSHCGRRSPLIFPSRSGGGTGGPSNRAGPVGVGDSPIPSFKRTPPDQLEDESGHSTASASPPTPSKTASHLHGRDADRLGDGGGGTITTKTNIGGGGGGGGKLSSDSGSKWMSEMDRSSPISSTLSSSSCAGSASGYDSPASEFCYESGSEYDLVG